MSGGGVREIPVGHGRVALVDEADFAALGHWRWYASTDGYVYRGAKRPHGLKRISLHRAIMEPPPGMVVDHANGDPLDNRRCNLRFATLAQNAQNQKQREGKAFYKGVSFESRRKDLWRARIFVGGKPLHLGCHSSPEIAARAYDAAALTHFGEFARLNFPDSTATPPPKRVRLVLRGDGVGNSKLDAAAVLEIRRRSEAGARQVDLAREFGVTSGAIYSVVNRVTWRHVAVAA